MPWTQSIAPNGRLYYFNTDTLESSWLRPPEFNPPPPPGTELVVELKIIPNSDWAICLTDKKHEFFYNLKLSQSTWDIPEEIIDTVGALLNEAMGIDLDSSEEESENEYEGEAGNDMDSIAETLETIPEDENKNVDNADIKSHTDTLPEKKGSDNPIPSLPEVPVEKRTSEFLDLLRERKISPFSSWAIEWEKLADDRRFIQISSMKERKIIFDKFCQTESQKVIDERKNKTPMDLYLDLLSEFVNVRTRFEDFVRRFKRDVRFTKFGDANERERLFKLHIAQLKKQK